MSYNYLGSMVFILTTVSFFLEAKNSKKVFQKRYSVIKQYLDQYSRPFTALEVNASVYQPFSLAISNDYQSTCLMFGSENYSNVVALCKKRQQDNLLIATQSESYKYYNRLKQCEHFDVVIIPEVRFKRSSFSGTMFDLYTQLGDHTIIEFLSAREEELPEQFDIKGKQLRKLSSVVHSTTKKSTFYCSYNQRTSLQRRRWTAKQTERRFYEITATFSEKSFKKRESKGKSIPWSHGINLLTFAKLKGIYPTKELIAQQIRTFSKVKHGDFAMGNIIIQGNSLKLIDWESHKISAPPEERVERIIAKLFKNLGSKRNFFD